MIKLYTYAIGPIDFWEGWSSVDEMMSAPYHDVAHWGPDTVRERFWAAQEAARQAGWEGDGKARVTVIPMQDVVCEIVIAIKQSNNGTTFIVSPVEMPWLGEPYGANRRATMLNKRDLKLSTSTGDH